MRILQAVPASVLWLKQPGPQAQVNLAARATAPLFDTARFARNIEDLYARILGDRLNG